MSFSRLPLVVVIGLIHVKGVTRGAHKVSSHINKKTPMFGSFRSTVLSATIVTAAIVVAGTSSSQAENGTVRFTVAKAGFIIGVGGGSGTLHFKGKTYRLHVDGISAGTIGVASAELVGTASNLQTAADIEGSYTAASASVAIAGGGKTARLQNAKGVVLDLRGRQAGFEASFNLGGVNVRLQ